MHSPFSFWNALKIPIKIASRSDYTSDKVNYWEVWEQWKNGLDDKKLGWKNRK